jgi:hypothetical protein
LISAGADAPGGLMLDGVIFEAVFRNLQIDALDELVDLAIP